MYSDDQPRDSRGRFASGGSGGRLTSAAAERAALYKKQDESLYHNTGSARSASPSMDAIVRARTGDGARAVGVHSVAIDTLPGKFKRGGF